MNGERKIEIFAPFGEAYERMKKILFRPFDISKWFIIGFAAFLAGNFGGGFSGFGWPNRLNNLHAAHQNQMTPGSHLEPWAIVAIAALVVFIFALVIVWIWLLSRGRFIFTDCIVQNRGAIAQPWREFRKEGNSYFLFTLAVAAASTLFFALFALAICVPLGLLGGASHPANTLFVVIFGALFFMIWICAAMFIGLASYFMVPVMYVQRCRALEAFREMCRLMAHNLAPFVLFCLFWIVLIMAMVIVSGVVACLTCCIAALPYIGTVILLPIFVWLHTFSFCFLRQFGPEYDVWTKITSPEVPPTTSTSPPPPLPA
jgi:MFS family permease